MKGPYLSHVANITQFKYFCPCRYIRALLSISIASCPRRWATSCLLQSIQVLSEQGDLQQVRDIEEPNTANIVGCERERTKFKLYRFTSLNSHRLTRVLITPVEGKAICGQVETFHIIRQIDVMSLLPRRYLVPLAGLSLLAGHI